MCCANNVGGDNSGKISTSFALDQNYPNPFNPSTTISYQLQVTSHVELTIYSIPGHKIETLISEQQQADFHQFEWDGSDLASGVYFYKLSAVDAAGKGKGFVEIEEVSIAEIIQKKFRLPLKFTIRARRFFIL